jgi:hypothetical protein
MKVKIYRTTLLLVVLCGCETWLKLWKEHMLRVFNNKVLRKMFGLKREEVTGNLGKLCNEKFHDFYSSPNIISKTKSRKMK